MVEGLEPLPHFPLNFRPILWESLTHTLEKIHMYIYEHAHTGTQNNVIIIVQRKSSVLI